jgi:isopentenyldiphosphate isomerase
MNVIKKELENIADKTLNFSVKENGLILATSFEDTSLGDKEQDLEGSKYEWFQIFDQNDRPYNVEGNDLVFYRKECHGDDRLKGFYHRGANAFIINNNDEILVPTRSSKKDLFPSMSDVSVSEHVNVKESYFDSVLRGFQEEQGISIDPKNLQFIMKVPVIDNSGQDRYKQSEMCEYYVCRIGHVKGSDEIASQRWIPIASLVGKNIGKELNFRPDHLPALEKVVSMYK